MAEKTKNLTLRDILEYYSDSGLPTEWTKNFDNIFPDTTYKVKLAFMCEDETHILTYATHPILIPWYDCPVANIDIDGEDTLRIWLRYETWYIQNILPNNKRAEYGEQED